MSSAANDEFNFPHCTSSLKPPEWESTSTWFLSIAFIVLCADDPPVLVPPSTASTTHNMNSSNLSPCTVIHVVPLIWAGNLHDSFIYSLHLRSRKPLTSLCIIVRSHATWYSFSKILHLCRNALKASGVASFNSTSEYLIRSPKGVVLMGDLTSLNSFGVCLM